MKANSKLVGNMLNLLGMMLFIVGIGGIGCSVWMFVSNNGGPLHWLSILVGLVFILVTALGYVLMGERERQEKAKDTKISQDELSQSTWHEFVRVLTFIFGVILTAGGVGGIVFTVLVYISFNRLDPGAGELAVMFMVPTVVGPSILVITGGFLLVRKVLRNGKANQKRISKD